jgi:RNA recognition motif-containing protein
MIWFMLSGTTADDLFPLFDKYGKVVDIFIPRDRRLLLLSPSSQLSLLFFFFCFYLKLLFLVV